MQPKRIFSSNRDVDSFSINGNHRILPMQQQFLRPLICHDVFQFLSADLFG
jgi:hypothetical protein